MKRKVIQLAHKTFVVSLPSKWVKKQGIKKGDELEVEEREKSIVVGTERTGTQEKINIGADQLGVLTKRYLFRQYHEGVDEIQLNFGNPEEIKNVREYISELIGYEITKQGNTYAVINDISGQTYHDFDQIIRRLFLLLKGIIEDSHKIFIEKNMQALPNVISRDVEINKFTHFCLRSLSRQDMKETKKTIMFYIIYTLERIGDDFKIFLQFINESKQMPDQETIKAYTQIKDLYSKVYEFTFDNKLATAKEIAKIYWDAKSKTYSLARKKNAHTALFLRSIVHSLITIQELQLPYLKI